MTLRCTGQLPVPGMGWPVPRSAVVGVGWDTGMVGASMVVISEVALGGKGGGKVVMFGGNGKSSRGSWGQKSSSVVALG